MNKEQRQRLVTLRDKLKRDATDLVERRQFHLDTWLHVKDDVEKVAHPGRIVSPQPKTLNECGFIACAIGIGSTLPSWQKAGFKMYRKRDGLDHLTPRYRHYAGELAVEKFLGLKNFDVHNLFMPSAYVTDEHGDPRAVARRITAFLENS